MFDKGMNGYRNPEMGAQLTARVEKWGFYRENTHRNFRVTPRVAWIGLVTLGFIPYAIFKMVTIDQAAQDEFRGVRFEYLGGRCVHTRRLSLMPPSTLLLTLHYRATAKLLTT